MVSGFRSLWLRWESARQISMRSVWSNETIVRGRRRFHQFRLGKLPHFLKSLQRDDASWHGMDEGDCREIRDAIGLEVSSPREVLDGGRTCRDRPWGRGKCRLTSGQPLWWAAVAEPSMRMEMCAVCVPFVSASERSKLHQLILNPMPFPISPWPWTVRARSSLTRHDIPAANNSGSRLHAHSSHNRSRC
jgi:hypothetical protein